MIDLGIEDVVYEFEIGWIGCGSDELLGYKDCFEIESVIGNMMYDGYCYCGYYFVDL